MLSALCLLPACEEQPARDPQERALEPSTLSTSPEPVATGAAKSAAYKERVGDTGFKPHVESPAFAEGEGPTVLIDRGHKNRQILGGLYDVFQEQIRLDGFVVEPSAAPFTSESLARGDIMVIVNALSQEIFDDGLDPQWPLPPSSSFTGEEIRALIEWIQGGGALLLIVDHQPVPSANVDIARALGLRFHDGYAYPQPEPTGKMAFFVREQGSLRDHAIMRGREPVESIKKVVTFVGSAFAPIEPDPAIEPLLVFGPSSTSHAASAPWTFDEDAEYIDIDGWLQGAAIRLGKGRVAVFGEAGMFTAKIFLSGEKGARRRMGLNSPAAPENAQFLTNVVRWLAGVLD